MTHTIEGDNIHFTFITPEGKQRKITLSLSEDNELINQILSIKDRTSREAALGYLFMNGKQEPRSEEQLLSLTDPKQDILTIQDLYTQINSIDGLIESLKEKLKSSTPEQKKEYENRIKELEKDRKRLQQQSDLIKNKNQNRTQTTSMLDQLLTIASNPETTNEKFENMDEFKEFLNKVKGEINIIQTSNGKNLSEEVEELKNILSALENTYSTKNISKKNRDQRLEDLKKQYADVLAKIKNHIEQLQKETTETEQKITQKIQLSESIMEFLKKHPNDEKLTKDNLIPQLKFINKHLNEETAYIYNFESKIKSIANDLNLNDLYKYAQDENNEKEIDIDKLYVKYGSTSSKPNIQLTKADRIVPYSNNLEYGYVSQLFTEAGRKIGGWGALYDINTLKKEDLPWPYIAEFIRKIKENFEMGLFDNGLGFKDLFTSKKVKENIQSNNEDIKTLKSQLSDLKEELKEIKNLLKNQQPQPIQQPKNFQNYLKDIENITLNKLRHTEPKIKHIETEQNEIAKKILDRRNDLMPDYSTDDDEPWDD